MAHKNDMVTSRLGKLFGFLKRETAAHHTKLLKLSEIFGSTNLESIANYEEFMKVGTRKVWATWKAIDICAKAVTNTPSKIIRAGKPDAVVVPGLSGLMSYPNEMESWRDFLYRGMFHRRLTGMSVWVKAGANLMGDKPDELYALNPRHLSPIPGRMGNGGYGVAKWRYYVNGEVFVFDPEELIIVRRPHPDSDIWGLGDVEAGQGVIGDFVNRQDSRKAFFKNGAMPSGVLIIDGPTTEDDDEFDKAQKKFNEKYAGTGNAGRTVWLSGKWTYQKLGLDAKEMEDIEHSKLSVEQIFLLHGVPLSVAGIRDAANYATAEIDDQRFKEYTVLPDVLAYQDAITTDLVQGYGPQLMLHYMVQGLINVERVMAKLGPLFDRGGLSINELRAACGFPMDTSRPDWEQCYIDNRLVPLDLSGIAAIGQSQPSGSGLPAGRA